MYVLHYIKFNMFLGYAVLSSSRNWFSDRNITPFVVRNVV